MGCCGKQRTRFLSKVQQKIEIDKQAKAQSNVLQANSRAIEPSNNSLLTTPDDKLTPRQQRIKWRILRQKRREARNARIALRQQNDTK